MTTTTPLGTEPEQLSSKATIEAAGPSLMPGAEPFLYEAGEVGCVLVHGFTSTPWEMRALGRYLADRGVTVYAPLLAGHGTTHLDLQGKTWHDWHASVNEALDMMLGRCKKVYLAGLSLGGALSLYTAAERGSDLAGIVVMSAPIYLPPGLGLVLKGMQTNVPYLYKPFRDIEDPVIRGKIVGYTHSPVDSIASLIEFLGPVRASLPKVEVPALVIYARRDHVVPGVSSHHIYSQLGSRDKKLLALHRGFHIVTVDLDHMKVFRAVEKFIRRGEED